MRRTFHFYFENKVEIVIAMKIKHMVGAEILL